MVLVSKRDKRRGNESEDVIVASDKIASTKGFRSLGGARTGRFAADMRVNIGGYGRADKTWAVDHPWHQTQDVDLFAGLCAKDKMEEGGLVKELEQEKQKSQGHSRAALKRMKAKMKKGGVHAAGSDAAISEAGDHHEEQAETQQKKDQGKKQQEKQAEQEQQETAAAADSEPSKSGKKKRPQKKKKTAVDEKVAVPAVASKKEQQQNEPTTADQSTESGEKPKRKRVKRKKSKSAKAAEAAEEDEDEEAEEPALTAEESAEARLKAKKKEQRDKDKQEKKAKKEKYLLGIAEKKETKEADVRAREVLAKQYEAAFGTEITTKSELIIHDQRLGKGRLIEIGEMFTVKYRGRLGKEGLVFGKGMLSATYGTGSVIAGWEEGMGTMRPGGIRHLIIPSDLAYGATGKGGKIPPFQTLFFEVELVRIGKRKRETAGKDEIPLPSSFQRKRIKQKSDNGKDNNNKDKPQKKRRKNND